MQRTYIKLANGKFAKTHDEEMKRWRDHFQDCPEVGTISKWRSAGQQYRRQHAGHFPRRGHQSHQEVENGKGL